MGSQQKFPTNATGINWTNPGNVLADDGARASYTGTTQDELKVTGFGFTVPLNATITGITVRSQGQGASATAAHRQARIGLTKDGSTLVGTRKTGVQYDQGADTDVDSGGPADLWGTTWTPAEINMATFGVLLGDNDTTAAELQIDLIRVTIHYTIPTFPAAPKPHYVYRQRAQFKTLVSQFEGKMEQRRKKWSTPRYHFTLRWENLDEADLDLLWNFYQARAGMFEAFEFVNPIDTQTYTVRFVHDEMDKEWFAAALFRTGLELIETNA